VARPPNQRQLLAQLCGLISQQLIHARIVDPRDDLAGGDLAAVTGTEQVRSIRSQVIDPQEPLADTDRPGDGGTSDLQHLLDLVQDLKGVPALPVELVDEGEDGGIPQPAHIHELDGALLHALGHIDDHQGGVHGREGTVGIFGEILVARRIQQVDGGLPVGELHDRRGHRDAALLLQRHPVGSRMACGLAALDGTRHLDGAAEEQQFFRQGRLARVRVGDDSKRASLTDFIE